MIMGLLLPDARKMAVAAETSREPRGTSRTFLDKRVDAIVHQTPRLRTLKSSLACRLTARGTDDVRV
jgi:hypothetical protein